MLLVLSEVVRVDKYAVQKGCYEPIQELGQYVVNEVLKRVWSICPTKGHYQ